MSEKLLALCLDCGDTLVDEGTEVKEGEVSLRAQLIPTAEKLLHTLKARGYPLALVADGPTATFQNNLGPYGLFELFDAYAISGEVGVQKPDARMFTVAMDALGIAREDYDKVIMVGNNLARDIRGANQLGMISVWLDWSPRYPRTPASAIEIPRYTIARPIDLLNVIDDVVRGCS